MDLIAFLRSLIGGDLHTLKQDKKFTVKIVATSLVIINVNSTGNERFIRLQEIKEALEALLSHGNLTRTEIHERFSPRNPAYVAAILSKWPGVRSTTDPIITLFYK